MKILIVEDEIKTATYLQQGLSEQGYSTSAMHNGEDGLRLALSEPFDLIILDAMMPKMDGTAMIRALRKEGSQTLVMFLTARDSLRDRVQGLDDGADAYLVKPFAFTELLAQVKTLLRRSPSAQSGLIQIADLVVDPIQHLVTRAGKRIELAPKEFALLAFLGRRKGEVLSRTLIASQVWNMNFDSETNVVDVHVARLRSKIDQGHGIRLIHTVRGRGYKLSEQA